LPPSTADLTTLAGIEQERLDLERLHRAGRIDAEALRTAHDVLAVMARGVWRRERLAHRR
jgi:hypothetical protein